MSLRRNLWTLIAFRFPTCLFTNRLSPASSPARFAPTRAVTSPPSPQGDYERAYLIARETNPFASTCGWVCGAPCEAACRRGKIDAPISIRALKRFVDDRYGVYLGESGEAQQPPAWPAYVGATGSFDLGNTTLPTSRTELNAARRRGDKTGKRVAIVGAGPAGLSCAHDLALLGHEVTIFDAASVAGGMLRLACRNIVSRAS